jgi:hypothetical protein
MLMNWSSPFPHEESQINMLKKKARPKLTSTKQLEQMEQTQDDEDELQDYVPKFEKKEKGKEKEKEMKYSPMIEDPHPLYTESLKNTYDTPMTHDTPFEYGNYKNNQLVEKLNYMIYLLEEQRDEKTGQVTEELILYVFLGVFVLFVLDSFFKTGKYTR